VTLATGEVFVGFSKSLRVVWKKKSNKLML